MPDLSLPRGVLTPMITPFRNGAFDKGQLAILIERQITAGIHGLIFGDQMGEGWSLSLHEQQDLFGAAGETVKERVPIIATVGTYCTAQTIDRIKALPQTVSALIVTVPYYSKPTAKGIIHHLQKVAESTELPIIIDDDPGRCVRALTPDILHALSSTYNIRGIRHCSGDIANFIAIPSALKRRFTHYAGDDRTSLAYLMVGATSVSSPVANLLPDLVRSFYDLTRTAAIPAENALHGRLSRAVGALGELEPPNIKYALSMVTGCGHEVRLPLLALDDHETQSIATFMARYVSDRQSNSRPGRIGDARKFL